MKKIFLIIFFSLVSYNLSASEKIAIADVDFILKSSKKGISIQNKFKAQNEKVINKFKKKEQKLKDKELEISKKKNVLSDKDFNKEVSDFKKEVESYNLERKKESDKLTKDRNTEIVKLLKEINLILVEYSKKNNLSTVLDKKYVIMTKSENDITKNILEILDK
ncbi:OmpH family outer membrane protein [Candidatus Pelagibacter sp.]|nr:OmpH family outer membrane protein [Candidatus Pelagibacter sp.]|tara:strand:- start:623 stop:1114 length:492 start_codon:yes stop_codon:yes gene_type:complete